MSLKKRCKATTYNDKKIEFSLNLKSLMKSKIHKYNFHPKVNFYIVGSSLTTLFH